MSKKPLKNTATVSQTTLNLYDWMDQRGFFETTPDRDGFVRNIEEELQEWKDAWDSNDEHEKIDAIADIAVFCYTEMMRMGYHPDMVLHETYKEINSREGDWNPETGKWEKFKTPKAMAKWYKADYSKCKL